MIRVDLLGPSRFRYDGQLIPLTPAERLAHLALVVAGGTLTITELADDIWTTAAPANLATLRARLSRSRRKAAALGADPADLSRTERRPDGASLIIGGTGWDMDADRFTASVAEAGQAYGASQYALAHDLTAEAIKLCPRDPVPDAGNRPFAIRYRRRLRALRLSAQITWLKAALCLGNHREIIADMEDLSDEHPGDAELVVLHATTLYRSGRTVDAATVLKRAITRLGDLGIEAPQLGHLQERILSGAASRNGPADG